MIGWLIVLALACVVVPFAALLLREINRHHADIARRRADLVARRRALRARLARLERRHAR